MNRLLLIGNGFDLAHGLKTKYEDFIDWYLNQKNDSSGILYKEFIRNYDMHVAHMNEKQIRECMIEPCTFLRNILMMMGTNGWTELLA